MPQAVLTACAAVLLLGLALTLAVAAGRRRREDPRRAPTDDNPAFGADTELPPGGQRRTRRGLGYGRDGNVPSRHRLRNNHRRDRGADRVDVAALIEAAA